MLNEPMLRLIDHCGGLKFPDIRGKEVWMFTDDDLERFIELLVRDREAKIQQLESKVFTLNAQNEIYKGVVYDNN